MNLAIDVASGEKPLEELVLGAVNALAENNDINLILVGNEKSITKALSKAKYDHKRVDIRHTDEIIDMNESPANGIKHKKNASVLMAARLVKDKEADGFRCTYMYISFRRDRFKSCIFCVCGRVKKARGEACDILV